MRVADLEHILDRLAPFALAEPWDNAGLQVGDREAAVSSVMIALDLTSAVLDEAVARGCDAVVTHHPLLFAPVRSLSESRPRERLLRRLVAAGINVISCHTNLDSCRGGIGDAVAEALGLREVEPLQPASAGWLKLVGFVPADTLDDVAAAVFAAGAGAIGEYTDCAFATDGQGWFTPGAGARPAVGRRGAAERTPEVRWETVVPRGRLAAVMRAYVRAHPYEEPAFDIYPVEDVLPRVGLGRVGRLDSGESVGDVAARLAGLLDLPALTFTGDSSRRIERLALVPGSGASMLDQARGRADAFITGDVSYHDAEKAEEADLALIVAPHGELEWLGMTRWAPALAAALSAEDVPALVSSAWRAPWTTVAAPTASAPLAAEETRVAVLRVDGGSRGNPGPSAIGVVLEDGQGVVLQETGQAIGVATNNVAEYRALLAGLEAAQARGITDLVIYSDSELLVKQLRGEYRVKSETLRPLHEEATHRLAGFPHVAVEHTSRENNAAADCLVNQALDAALMDATVSPSGNSGLHHGEG